MRTITLFHKDILASPRVAQLTRGALSTRRPDAFHGHDFHELFWVQNGLVRHHRPQGVEEMAEGQIAFLRPGEVHALQGKGEGSLVVSVSFHPEVMAGLVSRHPALGLWADATGSGPIRLGIRDSRQLAELNQAALRLERGACDLLAAEGFLLPLLAGLMAEMAPALSDAPDWLVRACMAAEDPAVFRDGAAGLVRLTGKAHPHVSRSMQRYLGQTPTEYVNARRIAFAAARLTGSNAEGAYH